MANDQARSRGGKNQEQPKPVGDNRRAGDTDGNAAAGNTKAEGANNPANPPGPARKGQAT